MSSRPPTTPGSQTSTNSRKSVRATVTGVDSDGQIFRDDARIILLKGQKCVYLSQIKPAAASSVLIDLRIGAEPWRSNAKVKTVSATRPGQDTFRVTLELDRVHDAVIEVPEEEIEPQAQAPVTEKKLAPKIDETPADNALPAQTDTPELPQMPDFRNAPIPAAEPTDAIASLVQSMLALELGSMKLQIMDEVTSQIDTGVQQSLARIEAKMDAWRREVQDGVAGRVDAALRQPMEKIETRIEQIEKMPSLAESSVRNIAAQAAENAQIEWATTSQKIVSEAVRSAMVAESEQHRREMFTTVSDEMDRALRGRLAASIEANVAKAVDSKWEQRSHQQPSMTETAVRQLATQVAEGVQLNWASTKMQKMVAEAVRSASATDKEQRQTEMSGVVKSEIEVALRGMLSARLDAAIEKAVASNVEQYFQTPSAIGALQKVVTETVRQALEAEQELERQMKSALQRIMGQPGS